ncbi:MAG: DUF2971 domain-containing protein [Legionellales bacterium]|jgi:hypothetical protein
MCDDLPPVLYKYRAVDNPKNNDFFHEHTEPILSRGEIYFAKVHQFNDPFEHFFSLQELSCTKAGVTEKAIELLDLKEGNDGLYHLSAEQNTINHILMAKIIENGVFCLNESKDSIYMFSHYADGFKGICIGFDSEIFKNHSSLIKVNYKKRAYKINHGNVGKDWSSVFKSKHTTFAQEKEWRVYDSCGLLKDKTSAGLTRDMVHNSIKEIIFGFNISKRRVEQVIQTLGKINPKFYVAVPSIGEYKIDVIEYNNYEQDIARYKKIYGYPDGNEQ